MTNDNKHIVDDELLARFLAGEADHAEINVVNSWAEESEENRKRLKESTAVWEKTIAALQANAFDEDLAWNKVRSRIRADQAGDGVISIHDKPKSSLKSMLKIKSMPKHLDASDGLAAAVCHYFQKGVTNSSQNYNSWESFVAKNQERVRK